MTPSIIEGSLVLAFDDIAESRKQEGDRLIRAIERRQFQDIPGYCRSMSLDMASKSEQLSSALERLSLSELRTLFINEGAGIAASLRDTGDTITRAMDLIYREDTEEAFGHWLQTPAGARLDRDGITLGNLQADLHLVLQHVEALSRRFLEFIEQAQKVRHEGVEEQARQDADQKGFCKSW